MNKIILAALVAAGVAFAQSTATQAPAKNGNSKAPATAAQGKKHRKAHKAGAANTNTAKPANASSTSGNAAKK